MPNANSSLFFLRMGKLRLPFHWVVICAEFPLMLLSLQELYYKCFLTVTTQLSILLVQGITNHTVGKVILPSIISIAEFEMNPRFQSEMYRWELWPSSYRFSWAYSSITETGVICTQNKNKGLSLETTLWHVQSKQKEAVHNTVHD